MRDLVVFDLGSQFGLGVGEVFTPWHSEVVRVSGLNSFDHLLNIYKDAKILACFGGGADVHPSLYGHVNIASGVGPKPSYRDIAEQVMFNKLVNLKIPIFGICRGAQLVCALSGGALIQDVSNHATGRTHPIITKDGREILMSSYHHQMMMPMKVEHELVAWSTNLSSNIGAWDSRKMVVPKEFWDKEPEIVYFPKVNALAVQGHPEFMSMDSEATCYTRELIQQYLFS